MSSTSTPLHPARKGSQHSLIASRAAHPGAMVSSPPVAFDQGTGVVVSLRDLTLPSEAVVPAGTQFLPLLMQPSRSVPAPSSLEASAAGDSIRVPFSVDAEVHSSSASSSSSSPPSSTPHDLSRDSTAATADHTAASSLHNADLLAAPQQHPYPHMVHSLPRADLSSPSPMASASATSTLLPTSLSPATTLAPTRPPLPSQSVFTSSFTEEGVPMADVAPWSMDLSAQGPGSLSQADYTPTVALSLPASCGLPSPCETTRIVSTPGQPLMGSTEVSYLHHFMDGLEPTHGLFDAGEEQIMDDFIKSFLDEKNFATKPSTPFEFPVPSYLSAIAAASIPALEELALADRGTSVGTLSADTLLQPPKLESQPQFSVHVTSNLLAPGVGLIPRRRVRGVDTNWTDSTVPTGAASLSHGTDGLALGDRKRFQSDRPASASFPKLSPLMQRISAEKSACSPDNMVIPLLTGTGTHAIPISSIPGAIPAPVLAPRKKRHSSKEQLTEEEKRANHIASEQKRRRNIRLGFRALTQIIPDLRQFSDRFLSDSEISSFDISSIQSLSAADASQPSPNPPKRRRRESVRTNLSAAPSKSDILCRGSQ